MAFDIPVFKKCCFCIPLRPGLLVWGYLRLLSNLLLIFLIGKAASDSIFENTNSAYIVNTILMIVLVINLVLNIVFVVGAHRKHEKLIQVYYKYCIVLLILNVIVVTGFIIYQVIMIAKYTTTGQSYVPVHLLAVIFVKELIVYFLDIILQGYLLMLIRSQLLKLRDTHGFEFVNNSNAASDAFTAADDAAVCNMVVTIGEKKFLP